MTELENLQAELGQQFQDIALLRLALTHPSIAHESGSNLQHNQRLEFLGDAVLQLILTRELYEKFSNAGEGPLTKARAQLVNRRTLEVQARRLNLGQHLVLSRGEEQTGGRDRSSALADCFEALLGAIYLDGGIEQARQFILRQYHEEFGELEVLPNLENPKGELQELLQSSGNEAPNYLVHSATGPDHDREFECAVQFAGEELGRGKGKSKKAAESQAALVALAALKQKGVGVP